MRGRHVLLGLLGTGLGLVAVLGLLGAASPTERHPATAVRVDGSTSAPRSSTTASRTPTSTTEVPATTATTAPAPTSTAPAAPRPIPAPAPTSTAPAPAAPPPTAPPVAPTAEYARSLLREVIPAPWLAAVPVQVNVIAGTTSWSSWGGLIEIGDWHLTSSVLRAKSVLAHEWGHQVAWHYGTDAYNGAPPAGFPYGGPVPEEMWADCVAQVLTGLVNPSHGLGPCQSGSVTFTSSFLAAGPGPRLR